MAAEEPSLAVGEPRPIWKAAGEAVVPLSNPHPIIYEASGKPPLAQRQAFLEEGQPEKHVQDILGVILAGGRSLRMGGGDKCLRLLAGRPILEWVIERVTPQVPDLIINANGDPERFTSFHLAVVSDVIEGFAGPLAGILTAMEWATKNRPTSRWVASFPCDSPFLPTDMVMRMLRAVEAEHAEVAHATSSGHAHPVSGLWKIDLAEELRQAIVEHKTRKIDLWTRGRRVVEVAFANEPMDPFFNVNSPEDLAVAESRAEHESFRCDSDK